MEEQSQRSHQPVILEQVVHVLDPQPGDSYLDGTAGYGGHAAAVLERIGDGGRVILVDRDAQAIKGLHQRFGERAEIRHQSYLSAASDLVADGTLVNLILLDLGVSSPQLDTAERGFSFRRAAALDMRMDTSQPRTADEVVNHYPLAKLQVVIGEYGEEPRASRIAAAIVAARPIADTAQLATVIRQVVGRGNGRIDPATRTFQAIRIEVNEELDQLASALPLLVRLLVPGGRLAVISFHSLEDRAVKQFFATESRDCICPPRQPVCTCDHHASLKILTKRPITGTDDVFNPRARSAKLRAAEKLK